MEQQATSPAAQIFSPPSRDEFSDDLAIERPIYRTVAGDRVPSTQQFLAPPVARLLPEEPEAYKMEKAQQKEVFWMWDTNKAIQITTSPLTATAAVKLVLLDLPPEVLTHTLLYLSFTSVAICQGVSRYLHILISESTELQYYIHLGISGLVDNPRCGLSVSERLDKLLARERRWNELDLSFNTAIKVPFQFQFFDPKLSTGLLYGVATGGELRYLQIPTVPDQEVNWRAIHSEKTIITAGLCVRGQDLHVLITAQPRVVYTNATGLHTVNVIQVHINQLSTGKPHPDAQQAIISFEMYEKFEDSHVVLECAGNNLILVVRDYAFTSTPDDQVYVYEWKTGDLKLRISAPFSSYRFPLFLTTHIFLLPNIKTGELEYWRIPKSSSEPTPNQPFFLLSLPQLRPGNTFHTFTCRAEPNPRTQTYNTSKPFYTDPHHAIATFYVSIWSARSTGLTCFRFLVHRSSLIGCLDRFPTSSPFNDRPKPIPYGEWGPSICRWFNADGESWTETTFGQRYIAPHLEEGPEGTSLVLLNFNPIDVAQVLAARGCYPEAKALDEGSQMMARNDENEHTVGLSSEDDTEQETQYREDKEVPPEVREACTLGNSSEQPVEKTEEYLSSEPLSSAKAVIQRLDPLNDPYECFEDTVYSSLPYTMRLSRAEDNFDVLILDEESILGVRYDDDDRDLVKEIHVLHYG